jgi:hypothetical protein
VFASTAELHLFVVSILNRLAVSSFIDQLKY